MDIIRLYCPECCWWCDVERWKLEKYPQLSYCELCGTELVDDEPEQCKEQKDETQED